MVFISYGMGVVVSPHPRLVKGFTLTLIRMHDIRENDVAEAAGMSNIPWELEYGFQRHTDPQDTQETILEEVFKYQSSSGEGVQDGLSPDANGQFFTDVRVRRDGDEITVSYTREHLILLANKLLRKAAVDIAVAIQHEVKIEPCHLVMSYEICRERGTTKCLILDDMAHPLSQLLDLRGFSSIGKMDWVDEAEDVD